MLTIHYLMKDTELRQEKDRELYDIYLKGLNEIGFRNMHEAIDWVRSQPASKFYVSPKVLTNYIGAILNGSKPPKMFSSNEKKMKILYNMYLDFLNDNPECHLSRGRICEILVEEPAPMFFICHDSCMKAIAREKARRRREFLKRIER